MRTSMAFPIRFWSILLTFLLIYQFSTEASADWCKYEKEFDLTLDLSSSEVLAINAAAGDLEVRGVAGTDKAVIHGKLCVSKKNWLDEAEIQTVSGARAEINVKLPDTSGGWSFLGNNYALLDLEIELPQDLALEVKDSSGDAVFKNIGAINLQDSSGDIEIENATGPVSVKDSSGDINITNISNSVTVLDSSGDINVDHVAGNFTVIADSSGDINATDIDGTVLVKKDSSGDITVKRIGGDFRVLADGSGSIRAHDVQGKIQTPNDG